MSGAERERLAWVDAAKGAAILMVVLFHASRAASLAGELPNVVVAAIQMLDNVCIPLFFLASGVVSVRLLERPWARVLSWRVLPLLGLLVAWSALGHLVNLAAPLYPHLADPLPPLWTALWQPMGHLWFLHALILFVVLTRIVTGVKGRRGRLAGALLLLLVLGAAAAWTRSVFLRNLLEYLPFFLAGALLAPEIGRLARAPRGLLRLATIATAGLVAVTVLGIDGPTEKGLENILGTALAVAAVVALAGTPVLGRGAAALGRRSLALYLGHQPVIALAYAAMAAGGMGPVPLWLGLAAVAIAGALLFEQAARAVGLGWLCGALDQRPLPAMPLAAAGR